MPAQMSVDEMYQIEKYILNKNQNGNLTPSQFNLINNQAQFDYLNYLLGDIRKYAAGRPISPTEWGQSARIREALTPFVQPPTTLTINGATGLTPYPPDYEMWDAMYWGVYKQRVKFIQQGRLDSHLNSTINPIQRNPVFLSVYEGFQLYPVNIGNTQISYIRTPNPITWGFTNDIYGRPIYLAATSSQPQWQREDCLNIIARALKMIGVSLQTQDVSRYANEITNIGQ